jgi:hypothetical protein
VGLTVTAEGLLNIEEGITASAPATGYTLFTRVLAERRLPAYEPPSGIDSALQPFLARNGVSIFRAHPGSNALTGMGFTLQATGTAAALAPTTTNLAQSTVGLNITATASTSAVVGFRTSNAASGLTMWRGNAAGLGGFFFLCRFRTTSAWPANARCFVGLSSISPATAPADAQPSTLATLAHCLGVGLDGGGTNDANWQFMINDNVGTATKVNTGIARPTSDNQLLEIMIFAKPNDSFVYFAFNELVSGSTVTYTASTDLPANTQFLAPRGFRSVGGTNSAIGLAIVSLYTESDN